MRALLSGISVVVPVVVVVAVLLLTGVSHAQPTQTRITPSWPATEVIQTNPSRYEIRGGMRPGGTSSRNLFHSFGLFTIRQGDTAAFTHTTSGPPPTNILGRVVDRVSSEIYGTIDITAFPGAHLFLINPAGVVLGPNASFLNLNGSLHVSTADYIRFTDGARFYANNSLTGVTAAEPAAFGFLGPTRPEAIRVQTRPFLRAAKTLSFVGGDVRLEGGRLSAPDGRIQIASVGSAGEVTLSGPEHTLDVNLGSFARLGDITMTGGARIDTQGARGGTVVIRGGQLIATGSSIIASTNGTPQLTDHRLLIDLQLADKISLDGQTVVRTQSAIGAGRAGDISLTARTIDIKGGSVVDSLSGGSMSSTGGPTGNVALKATESLRLSGTGTAVMTATFDSAGGDVTIVAPALVMDDGAVISARTIRRGRAGDVMLDVGTASLRSGAHIELIGQIGDAGTLTVRATDLSLIGDSTTGIFGVTGGTQAGRPGNISLAVRRLTLSGGAQIESGTELGNGITDVHIDARESVTISNGSRIFITALETDVGGLRLSAPTLRIDNGAITASTIGKGRGGSIVLDVGTLTLTNGARISATTTGKGQAGNIRITARDGVILRNSSVTTDARTADGGNIQISGGSLVYLLNSQVTTSVGSGKGKGGNIAIDPQFVVLDRSQVRADAFGGPGGNITIASDFFLTNRSFITASSALSTSGTIAIQSQFTNINTAVAPLPSGLLHVATLLRASCAARVAAGKASSLVVSGREGMPPEPGGYLPSPLVVPEPGNGGRPGSGAPDGESGPRLSLSVFEPACSR